MTTEVKQHLVIQDLNQQLAEEVQRHANLNMRYLALVNEANALKDENAMLKMDRAKQDKIIQDLKQSNEVLRLCVTSKPSSPIKETVKEEKVYRIVLDKNVKSVDIRV